MNITGELLIELFCEEIPSSMQVSAAKNYPDIFAKYFRKHGIAYQNIEIFVGPRRVTIYATGVDKKLKEKVISVKGPKIDSLPSAIKGFCKSNNVSKDDLTIKEIKDTKSYFYEKKIASQEVKLIFLSNLGEPIMDYIWPKSMYWSDYKIKWVRPLKNILCIFDGEVVPFKLGHLTANNTSFGHRFMNPKKFAVSNFDEYKQNLLTKFVMLNQIDRIETIKNSLESEATKLNLLLKNDPELIKEVSGLVEYPVVLRGKIEQKFLDLPSEILVSSMRSHQKYFCLFDQNGKFAPYFLFVSNIVSSDPDTIIQGNEKVLSARLCDALYFYQQDLKKNLKTISNQLKKVTFHAKLGFLYNKTQRLIKLTKFIDEKSIAAIEAATICKNDIVSEVVGEFPNLQGIMAYYYALSMGAKEDVAIAIRDHYKPQGPSDSVPINDAAILALADKLDSLCGLMIAGEKPTGSKDPYALRRLALGIIRIIIENKLHQDITKLVEFSCSLYSDYVDYSKADVRQIIHFIEERIKNHFKGKFSHAQIDATVNFALETDLLVTKYKLEVLSDFLKTDAGEVLLNSYKRAINIIDNKKIIGDIDPGLFLQKEETALMNFFDSNLPKINQLIEKKDFQEILQILSSMNSVISSFFDNVMVMNKDPKIVNNRLLLLGKVKKIFNKLANFDLL